MTVEPNQETTWAGEVARALRCERLDGTNTTSGVPYCAEHRQAWLSTGTCVVTERVADALAPHVAHREREAEVRGVRAAAERIVTVGPSLNAELRYDGREDPEMAAYVQGHHDAWQVVEQMVDRIERGEP